MQECFKHCRDVFFFAAIRQSGAIGFGESQKFLVVSSPATGRQHLRARRMCIALYMICIVYFGCIYIFIHIVIHVYKWNTVYTLYSTYKYFHAAPRQASQDQSFARFCSCDGHVLLDVPKPCVLQKSCTSTKKNRSLVFTMFFLVECKTHQA